MAYEANSGHFYDFISIPLPLLLSFLLHAGGTYGMVLLLQCLGGFFGIRFLVGSLLEFRGLGQEAGDRLTSILILLLVSPLTPLTTYLATFWSDTWFAILLVWGIALLLNLYTPSQSLQDFRIKIAVFICLIAFSMWVRHNGVVIYPVAALALWIVLRGRSVRRSYSLGLVLAPALLFFLFQVSEFAILKVQWIGQERAVYALDLASMISTEPSICNDLSLGSCDLVLGVFPPAFQTGNGAIDFTFNQSRDTVFKPYFELFLFPDLQSEYFKVASEYPLLYARVKFLNFLDYVRPDPTRYFFQEKPNPNEPGISYDNQFEWLRAAWFTAVKTAIKSDILSWLSYVHATWFVIDLIATAVCLVLASRLNSRRSLFVGLLFLIPLAYYLSYLIALTGSEFRFMYPSMLIVQVMSLTLIGSFVFQLAPALSAEMFRSGRNAPSRGFQGLFQVLQKIGLVLETHGKPNQARVNGEGCACRGGMRHGERKFDQTLHPSQRFG